MILEGHDGGITCTTELSDGRVLSGSYDKTLKVWDPQYGRCLVTLEGHTELEVLPSQLYDNKCYICFFFY